MESNKMDISGTSKFQAQSLGYFNSARLLNLVDFPIYHIECMSERHFIITGGGGIAKTGILNQMNVFELTPNRDSCSAELVLKYNTSGDIPEAIMNASLMKDQPVICPKLVTSGSSLVIYDMEYNQSNRAFNIKNCSKISQSQNKSKINTDIKRVKCFANHIVSGSEDGQLKLWEINKKSANVLKNVQAYAKSIDEIDVDPINNIVVTLSRDEAKCTLWSSTDLKKINEFTKVDVGEKFKFRACRFAQLTNPEFIIPDCDSRPSILLLACNTLVKGNPCKICKWKSNNNEWNKKREEIHIPVDAIMAMTVSDNAKFTAIGSSSGSVFVYDINKLSLIYKNENIHNNIITSLDFLPMTQKSLNLTGSDICPLLSVGIDKRIILHRPKSSSLYIVLKSLFIVLLIYILYLLSNKYIL